MTGRIALLQKRWAVAVLFLGWLILCKPWFAGHRVVPWDSKDEFYPSARFVSQSLRAGESPFWNPYVYGGFPMASDPQSMLFSPIATVLMLVVNKPSIYWFDAIELIHILLGGLGMLLLATRCGRSPPAALFSAAVFMYGGPAAARLQHVPIIEAYAYFPFALLALEEMLETRRLRWAVCFGLIAGVMAAQLNQVAYLLSLVLAGYFIYRAAISGPLRRFAVTYWRVSAAAALTGILVLAIPVYLVFQFLPYSNRLAIPYEIAAANSLGPLPLLTLLFRNFFGSARSETLWGPWDVTESMLYAGTLPIVLILRYGVAGGGLLDRRIRYFSGVGVLSILYFMGNSTPFYWLAYHLVPGVSRFRRPSDAVFVLNAVLALATGFLVDRLQEKALFRPRRLWLCFWLPLLGGLLAWGFYLAWFQHHLRGMLRDLGLAALFILIALWLWHELRSASSQARRLLLSYAGIVLLAIDFGIHTVGTYLNAVSASYFPVLSDSAAQDDSVAHFLKDGLQSGNSQGSYRADITWAGSLWGNAPMILAVQSTQGYNPLQYLLYNRVAGAQDNPLTVRPFTALMPDYNSPLLNLLGVKYIVSAKPLAEIDRNADPKRFPLVFDGNVRIWQNANALPRILAATAVYLDPDLQRTIDAGPMAAVDYRSTVVLPHLPPTLAGLDAAKNHVTPLPGSGEPKLQLLEYRNTEVAIAVDSARDLIVELNDPYYFAWHVYVDGRERELLQANYLFRGVHVKGGERRVDFRFEPFSWSAMHQTLAPGPPK